MPEAPDLEVIKEFLNREARGREVESCQVLKPTVVRSLTGSLPDDVKGRALLEVSRKGKFLLLELSGDRWLAVNPMLTGALQFCEPGQRVLKKTCLTMTFSGDRELRYLDDRQMGKVYYATRRTNTRGPWPLSTGPRRAGRNSLRGISAAAAPLPR